MITLALLALAQDAPAADPRTALAAEAAIAAAARDEGSDAALARFARFPYTPRSPREDAPEERWSATRSAVSCDGTTAIVVGEWHRGDRTGSFARVWERQPDGGWRWSFGYTADRARGRPTPDGIATETASCEGNPRYRAMMGWSGSRDSTLIWRRSPTQLGELLELSMWTGDRYRSVVALSRDQFGPRRGRNAE